MTAENAGDTPEDPVSPEPGDDAAAPGDEAAPEGKPEAEGDDRDTGEKETGEGDEGAPEEGRGSAFEKLLAKYGGDKDKMASAYFEQASSNARLSERLQAIEQYIQGQEKQPDVDEKALVEADPDVKEIVQEYNEALNEVKATETEQNRQISRYGQLERQIEKLKGKLEASTDFEAKQEIRAELGEAVAEQKSVHADIRGSQADIKRLNQTIREVTRRYREAEGRAKESASRQRQEGLERRQEAIATRQEFAEAMRAEANRIGIPVESRQYAVLFQSINDRIYTYLSRLPKDAPGIDIAGAVRALMAEYNDSFVKSSFKKKSDAKREASSPGAKEAIPGLREKVKAETAPPKGAEKSAAYWRDRARRMMP